MTAKDKQKAVTVKFARKGSTTVGEHGLAVVFIGYHSSLAKTIATSRSLPVKALTRRLDDPGNISFLILIAYFCSELSFKTRLKINMAIAVNNEEKFLAVMFNLNNAIKTESELCCKACGDLNEKELFIIAFIGEKTSVKMSDIADSLQAPLSTLTTIIDKLVTNKFLLRYNSNDDRRVVKVELDRKGKGSFKEFNKRRAMMANKVLGHLNESEQESLITHLAQLVTSMQA